jgi:hypothetical protein
VTLTATPRPTLFYSRFKYGTSPVITVDIAEPVMAFLPNPALSTGLASENRVSSGKSEVLFGRIEEQCGLVLRCEADMLMRLRWMAEESAFRGTQFQAWVDRFTGSCWMFEHNIKDQNGLTLTLSSGSESYATASTGTGIVLTGTQNLNVTSAQASAGTPTGYDDPFAKEEGVLIVDVKPAFNANDSAEHNFVDTTPSSNSRLTLRKSVANAMALDIWDSTGTVKQSVITGAGSFVSGDRIVMAASWSTAGALTLALSVNGGAYTFGTGAGSGTGILSALPSTLFIGTNNAAGNAGNGTYDTVAFFKRAFSTPTELTKWRPWRRNYFPYGEITSRIFNPVQVNFGVPVWDWPITFRNGQP